MLGKTLDESVGFIIQSLLAEIYAILLLELVLSPSSILSSNYPVI